MGETVDGGLPATGEATPKFRGKILLAEDDEPSGFLAKLLMEQLGLQVDLATDGIQALDLATRHSYDMIVMDGQMPGMNGMEVTRKIRLLPEGIRRQVPIVSWTADTSECDASGWLDAGMTHRISKPLVFGELVQLLRGLLVEETGSAPSLPAAADTAANEEALIDIQRIDSLGGLDHPDIRRILENFAAGLPAALSSLGSLFEDKEAERLGTALHKMHGAAKTCGFDAISKAAKEWHDASDPFEEDLHFRFRDAVERSLLEWRTISGTS